VTEHAFIGRKVTYTTQGYSLTYEVWERLDDGKFLLLSPLGQERIESERDLEDYFNADRD
jgi:hypothetical protein